MTDDLKNAETSLVWALDKASTSLEVRSAVNKALGYVRQAQAPAQCEAAQPAAWLYEHQNEMGGWKPCLTFTKPQPRDWRRNIRALYVAPRSPADHPIGQGMLRTQEIMCVATMEAKITELAHRFWSIHPSSLDDMGLTREEFYASEMRKLIASRTPAGSAAMDYIVNGGDEVALLKAQLEHMGGALERELEENRRLVSQVESVAWRPISEYPAPKNDWDDPDSVMLWVADGGGKGSGCHAFGRVYRYADGTVRAVASGFSGDWNITHWKPLDPSPQHSSTVLGPSGGAK